MATELTKSHSTKQPAILKIMDGDPFLLRMREVYNTVAQRAYELFERRGCQDGHDQDDWFHAELELLKPVPVEISDGDDELTVRAEVPGFRDQDIEVRVEPHRLVISGKQEHVREETRKKTVYSEKRSNEMFRMLELPEEVDPDKVTAALQDGTLEISLPKAHSGRKTMLAAKAA